MPELEAFLIWLIWQITIGLIRLGIAIFRPVVLVVGEALGELCVVAMRALWRYVWRPRGVMTTVIAGLWCLSDHGLGATAIAIAELVLITIWRPWRMV